MANLIPWKPGQSGNPSGRRRDLITRDHLKAILSRFSSLTKKQLKEIMDAEDTAMLDAIVASIMFKALETGDANRLEFLFNRMIGKVKEELDLHESEERERLSRLSLKDLIIYIKSTIPEALE